MSEPREEALRRQTLIRVMSLISAGMGRCALLAASAAIFSKRRATPGEAKARCLACWRAER